MNLIERVLAGFGPEDSEQYLVIKWCDMNKVAVFHVPNSTWTKSVMQRTKNMLLGVRAGVPDLFIPLPDVGMLVIEMKRRKESKKTNYPTPAQREWIELLNRVPNTEAHVCYGADEAINLIASFLPAATKTSTTALPF